MNHADLVSAIRLPDNLFVDAGTEVSSDLIVLQKNTLKTGLSERERNFIETRKISGNININNAYANLGHIIHTSVSTGKNMYGQPAMNFIHDGGMDAISERLKELLAQDIGQSLDLKRYEGGLAQQVHQKEVQEDTRAISSAEKSVTPTFAEPEFIVDEPEDTIMAERKEPVFSKPYEPMLNLFETYTDEEDTEVETVKSKPYRHSQTPRKKKGDEPEMLNLFSQENMYDEAPVQEGLTK